MNHKDLCLVQKVSGSVVKALPDKTYLKKDIKLIMLDVIKELEAEVEQ